MIRILSSLLVLLIFVCALNAQVYQQVPNAGNINWQDQIIRATGIGAPNPKMPLAAQRAGALEAAKRIALRNLLETVKGMSITSETTVRNAMMENDVITTSVSGIVRNFRVVDTRYMSSGDVEVDVEVPISGVLADALLPMMGQPMQVGQGFPVDPSGYSLPQNVVFTGLIIDARGVGARPAMAPKILDESGNEVYGTGYVSREYAVQIGVVGYEKDINRAKTNERVTDNPLVVKATKASGTNKSDIVISNNDAQNVIGAAKNLNFMENCKVMVILD
ncbi:MAG: LPP20 family lipoprotein [Calditrichia bacterium]|nr:LPP20 family lipoprotein [Calditrichia bacterium]